MYEVAPVEAVQLSDAEALPAVAVRATGAAGTEPAPEELELLLDELDDDELEEELDDEEELLELEELLDDELPELEAATIATVVTTPAGVIFRMAALPVSAT